MGPLARCPGPLSSLLEATQAVTVTFLHKSQVMRMSRPEWPSMWQVDKLSCNPMTHLMLRGDEFSWARWRLSDKATP